jgi:hypothetical protein
MLLWEINMLINVVVADCPMDSKEMRDPYTIEALEVLIENTFMHKNKTEESKRDPYMTEYWITKLFDRGVFILVARKRYNSLQKETLVEPYAPTTIADILIPHTAYCLAEFESQHNNGKRMMMHQTFSHEDSRLLFQMMEHTWYRRHSDE